jgi:hypothetical protein
MGRLLELILFGFLLWLAYEGLKARVRAFFSSGPPRPAQRPPGGPPKARPEETLVRCARCGTHVPRSRALAKVGSTGSDLYCSERCRAAGA